MAAVQPRKPTNDAEAICEAAQRPTMRFVPVKSEETQGAAMVFRTRELLIRQLTQAINALRGHLGEFGQIVPQGAANAARLIAMVEDPDSGLPAGAIATLHVLVSALKAHRGAVGVRAASTPSLLRCRACRNRLPWPASLLNRQRSISTLVPARADPATRLRLRREFREGATRRLDGDLNRHPEHVGGPSDEAA